MALKVSLSFTDGSLEITKETSIDTKNHEEYATQFQIAVNRTSRAMLQAITAVYGDARNDPTSAAGRYCFELEMMSGLADG